MTKKMKTIAFHCRVINTMFHKEQRANFLRLNALKDRTDHENGTTRKKFFVAVSDLMSATMEDDQDFLINMVQLPKNDINKRVAEVNKQPQMESFNITNYVRMDSNSCEKLLTKLIKLRRQIQAFMTKSGTHDEDPWKYFERAKKHCRKCTGVHQFTSTYFFLHCNDYPQLDQVFVSVLDSPIKHSSNNCEQRELSTSTKKVSKYQSGDCTPALKSILEKQVQRLAATIDQDNNKGKAEEDGKPKAKDGKPKAVPENSTVVNVDGDEDNSEAGTNDTPRTNNTPARISNNKRKASGITASDNSVLTAESSSDDNVDKNLRSSRQVRRRAS